MKAKKLLIVLCISVFAVLLSVIACVAAIAQPGSAPMETVEDDSLNVTARTLALKDNVYIKYAVPVGEAENVKMLFWTSEQSDYALGTQAVEAEPAYQQVVDGVNCNIFQFKGMEDKQMTDVLYARAYAEVDGDRHYGDVNKYSVLQYAYNKQNEETPDSALLTTLDTLLNKGAAAQQAAGYKLDDLANEAHSIIHAVDEILSDGFADFLHPDSKQVTGVDKYLKYSGSMTFYIEFNITLTGYQTVEDYIYYFDAVTGAKKDTEYDTHMFDRHGRIYGDSTFVTINTEVYYLVSQKIVYEYYVILDQLYYFGTDGVMRTDTEIGGHYFGSDGVMVGNNVFFDAGDKVYYVQNNIIVYIYVYIEGELYLDLDGTMYPTAGFDSTVLESDNDQDAGNNDTLGGVTCTAYSEALGMTFVCQSDANGNFSFAHLPKVEFVFIFEIDLYITVTVEINMAEPNAMAPILLDRKPSEGLAYETISDIACRVTGVGSCTDIEIVIPDEYQGRSVTEIAEKAFYGLTDLISVRVPDTVEKIGDKAFADCPVLEDVSMPDNAEIGIDVFRGSIIVVIVMKHNVVFVDAKDATCTEPGNIAYYWCETCNHYYEDAYGTKRIYDVVIPNAHDFVGGACTKCGEIQTAVLITQTAELAHLGKFALGTLENAIGLPEMVNVYTADGRNHSLPVMWDLSTYNKAEVGEYTIYGYIQAAGFHFADSVSAKVEAKVDIVAYMKGTADIVFVLDVSGSMSEEVANVKDNVVQFAQKLEAEGVSARWAAVTYSDFADVPRDPKEQTIIIQNGATPWFSTATDYKKAINAIEIAYGGDFPEVAVDGLLAANTLENRKDARVFYILLTDATYKVDNHYGVESMGEATQILKDDGVNVSVITSSSYESYYSDLVSETGGITCNINGNFAQELFDSLVPIIYEDVIS